jgi:hypothetical protein
MEFVGSNPTSRINVCLLFYVFITSYVRTMGVHKSRAATKFHTVLPNICRSSLWNLLHVTRLALKDKEQCRVPVNTVVKFLE